LHFILSLRARGDLPEAVINLRTAWGRCPRFSSHSLLTQVHWKEIGMLGVHPFITFKGNCREAIDFYTAALGEQLLFK
jgi:hypothetical protein